MSVAPAAITNGSSAGMSSVRAPVAVVAGGGHHDDALAPQALDRPGQHVGPVVLAGHAEREVDDADVVAGRVVVAVDPLEGREHTREVRLAVGAGDLEADQARARGHAAEAGDAIAAGDQAREVRAVAERVEVAQVTVVALGREVRAVDHAARLGEAADRDHARVDEGDVDTTTIRVVDAGQPRTAGDPARRAAHLVVGSRRHREQEDGREGHPEGREAGGLRLAPAVPADPIANRHSVPSI